VSPATTTETAAETKGKLPHLLSRLRSYFILSPLIFFYTGVFGAMSLVSSFFDHEGRMQHNFARFWSHLILKTSMSPVEVIGLEKLNLSRPFVYAANHISAMDIPVLYDNLPIQFRIVANKYLFRYPFLGWHLKRSGQIPIDRSSPRATFKSLHTAVDDLKAGLSVMIFPEGGRSRDGHIMPFMNGAFYVAIKAQVDIVPLAIIGTFEMLPMDTYHIQPRRLQLVVGDPIPTTGLTTHDLELVASKAQKSIEDMYYSRAHVADPRVLTS
jgi:1-acyl-sn-glycerol-3-phosphate acyltransferase